MKYSLYNDLLNENHILSHLFLNCLSKQELTKIADKNSGLTEEQIKNRKVEIEVFIDGISVNPKNFFNLFKEQYESHLKKLATKMLKDQVSGKLEDIVRKIQNLQEISDSLAEEINWDIENPFKK
jgi:hypothetical protein